MAFTSLYLLHIYDNFVAAAGDDRRFYILRFFPRDRPSLDSFHDFMYAIEQKGLVIAFASIFALCDNS